MVSRETSFEHDIRTQGNEIAGITVILKPLLGATRYGSLLKKVQACFDLAL